MKFDDLPLYRRFEYTQNCSCGKKHIILSQMHDSPEYETEVYLKCDCGQYIEFNLPVN